MPPQFGFAVPFTTAALDPVDAAGSTWSGGTQPSRRHRLNLEAAFGDRHRVHRRVLRLAMQRQLESILEQRAQHRAKEHGLIGDARRGRLDRELVIADPFRSALPPGHVADARLIVGQPIAVQHVGVADKAFDGAAINREMARRDLREATLARSLTTGLARRRRVVLTRPDRDGFESLRRSAAPCSDRLTDARRDRRRDAPARPSSARVSDRAASATRRTDLVRPDPSAAARCPEAAASS